MTCWKCCDERARRHCALREVEGLGLVEAQRFLHESPAWADYMRVNDESLIAEIEAMDPEA